jgi:hypothetical protein
MVKAICIVVVVLAGCSGIPTYQHGPSACSASETSYECQVERYQNVNAN